MRIGVVADTHSLELPTQMLKDFRHVDLIVHAGDFCSWKDLEKFRSINEVQAVYGNMDEPNIRRFFPRKQILKLENVSIGLFHGEGSASHVLKKVKEEFKQEKLDCVIFGHSHHSLNTIIEETLYFNPGSPNDVFTAMFCSYGILEIKDNKIEGKIIKIK